MKLKVSVFEYLNQKVIYIQDVNYYFGIRGNFDIKLGNYELSEEEVLNIAKENDPEEYEVFISTSIEERLNKMKTFDIEEIKEQSACGQFTLCLHPSRKCNLNCKYCFKESEYLGNEQLTFEAAKEAIDFLVDKYAPCASKYVIDLSGSGEPLLQLDLVKQIVEYCKKKRNEICKNIEVMFCTNLTLLTPEIAEYLDNEPAIILGTSIDGDQITNDNNRVYVNGKGTYDDIVKGLKMFKNKKLGLAVTITPLNQDVDLIYDYLYHLPNVDCVSMSFIRCFDKSKYNVDNFDLEYLSNRYILLCENILKELKQNNFDYLKKLINGADVFGNYIIQFIFKGFQNIYKCDAGKNRIAINAKGDIFACSVMMGNKEFWIGNINTGIDLLSHKKFYNSPIFYHKKCKKCLFSFACGGECSASSYLIGNDLYTPIEQLCKIKINMIKIGISFIQNVKNESKSSYDKLLKLFFKIQCYYKTDSGIWATMCFLKMKKHKVEYCDLLNYIKQTSFGVEPYQILNYLKLYDANIESYEIDQNTSINDIRFPAICLNNKSKTNAFKYSLLINAENNNFIFTNSDISILYSMPFNEFLDKISNIFIF